MSDLVDEYAAWMRAGGMSARTVDERTALLRRLDRELPEGIERAVAGELTGWLNSGSGRWRPGTLRTYVVWIKAFYEWTVDPADPRLTFNPAAGLRVPTSVPGRGKPCTDEQLAEILRRSEMPHRAYAILASGNGLRCISIAALERADITQAELVVRQKGGRDVILDTHAMVWDLVRDLPDGLVAELVGGVADARWIAHHAWRHWHRQLGIPVSMHQLRHWHATALDRQGADLLTISQAMGHARISTTQGYIRRGTAARRAAIGALAVPG